MNEAEIAEQLLELLEAEGVIIRKEHLGGGGGGLCTIKGQKYFFADMQSSAGETAVLCAEAVLKVVDIDGKYLRPQVRQFIEDIGHKV